MSAQKPKVRNSRSKAQRANRYEKPQKPYKSYAKSKDSSKYTPRSTVLAPALSAVGAGIGATYGGPAGMLLGSAAGHMLGETVKYFTGFGDYTVKSNALLKYPDGAMVNRNSHGGTVIRKTEYLGDLFSSPTPGLFSSRTFNVNPGDDACFPWLSQIAANYEEYVLEGLYFEYRSMSADALNSTNTALGTVCLSAQYNVNTEDFGSKQEMENHEFGMSCKPSESVRFFIECQKNQSVLSNMYIRAPYNLSNAQVIADRRFSDICKFQIASQGLQGANVNLGEIHVTYQVALIKSRMFDTLGKSTLCYSQVNTVGIANTTPLGSQLDRVVSFDNIGIEQSGATTLIFPLGFNSVRRAFIAEFFYLGSSTTIGNPSLITLSSLGANISQLQTVPDNGNTVSKVVNKWLVVLDGSGLQINLVINAAAITMPTSATKSRFNLYQVPIDFVSAN